MPAAPIRRSAPGAGAGPDLRQPAPTPHLALVPPSVPASDEEQSARNPHEAFGARLKSARERRGITVRAVADTTKVTASLFEALERGDVSRWPKGIYKRSFFRGYVAAIGLPPDSTTEEFLRLFPDEKPLDARDETPLAAETAPAGGDAAVPQTALRLTLAPATSLVPLHRRLSPQAALDGAVVLAAAAALAWWSGLDVGTGAAFAAICYYPQIARLIRK